MNDIMTKKDEVIKKGYIVKSYEELFENQLKNYHGIGRYFSWPLDVEKDSYSRSLTEEAMEKWLGYQDNRMQVIPDIDYISRYLEHCSRLKIDCFCLLVERLDGGLKMEESVRNENVLGYDYIDVDMCTSCLYDDFIEWFDFFEEDINKLNENGLFSDLNDIIQYLHKRNELVYDMENMEEYTELVVARLTKVNMQSFAR